MAGEKSLVRSGGINLRTAHRIIESTYAVEFDSTKSLRQQIEEKLREQYRDVIIGGGKLFRIVSLDIEKYGKMERFNTTFEISGKFKCVLEIKYWKPGDVLFNMTIRDEETGIQGLRSVIGAHDEFQMIVSCNENIPSANVMLDEIFRPSPPAYKMLFAVYPNYAPISLTVTDSEEIEPPLYERLDMPEKLQKKYGFYWDPLWGMKSSERSKRIVSDIRKMCGMSEEPKVSGLQELLTRKKLPVKPLEEQNTITIIPINKLAGQHGTHAMYVPSLPLTTDEDVCAVVNNGEMREFSKSSCEHFTSKVSSYIAMKSQELHSFELLKIHDDSPLHKMYVAARDAILSL